MCASLLQHTKSDPFLEFEFYPALDGVMPSTPKLCDAWLLTGSKYSVYEDHFWIKSLTDFIQSALTQNRKVIGVCFGHQLLAQTLGGEVMRDPKGPSIGCETYNVAFHADGEPEQMSLHAWHFDQVTKQPPNTEIILTSSSCRYAGLRYGDNAISFQPHPEFSKSYMIALIKHYQYAGLNEAQVTTALQSLKTSASSARIKDYIHDFLFSP